ncbi:MAG: phosphoribosylanthranilate isomerase, partial [Sandaracinobacteroides sp.]
GGFVFFPPSPRAITPELAGNLAQRAPHLLKVGLFVDADDALIGATVAAAGLGALQLQGRETPARVAELKGRFGLPVWKAVGVKTAADVREASRNFAGADLLLLDAKPPTALETGGGALPGGNGLRFDWRILADVRPDLPWALAGGLTPESVGEAIRLTGAPMVDVSSGVEDAPGVKSVAKIGAFVESTRRA